MENEGIAREMFLKSGKDDQKSRQTTIKTWSAAELTCWQIVKETVKTVTAKIGFMTSLQEDLEMRISSGEVLSSTWRNNKPSQPGVTEGHSNGSSQDIPAKECLERQEEHPQMNFLAEKDENTVL